MYLKQIYMFNNLTLSSSTHSWFTCKENKGIRRGTPNQDFTPVTCEIMNAPRFLRMTIYNSCCLPNPFKRYAFCKSHKADELVLLLFDVFFSNINT